MLRFSAVGAVICCLVLSRSQLAIHAAATLSPRPLALAANPAEESDGAKAYAANCAICHGDHREGNLPAFPPLLGVVHHLSDPQITELVHKGQGRMPGIPDIQGAELVGLLHFLHTEEETAIKPSGAETAGQPASAHAEAGRDLFQQNCAFCHGRDAMGGETGPDLTRSKTVLADRDGDAISQVVREGRPEKKMPAFNFSAPELEGLAAFIHGQVTAAEENKGGRRGVDVADLQTGNRDAGKRYFDGPGGCTKCHSSSGDLAGVATRLQGLALEERMLYPRGAKSSVAVTLPSGQTVAGTLAYLDEFTVALRDSTGSYHSWQTAKVKYKVDSPVEAHVDLFGKYTDADIHNLMAYMQTLR